MEYGVLITDGQERSAVAACGSLASGGYRIGVAASNRPAPGQWSRRCHARYAVGNPRSEPRGFAEQVAGICADDRYRCVIPGSDASLRAISENREVFSADTPLGLPSREAVDQSLSKLHLIQKAEQVGLTSPESAVCADREAVLRAAASYGYPVLLKPRRTVFRERSAIHQRASRLVADERSLLSQLPRFGSPCVIQRHEDGAVVSFAGIVAGGELVASVFARYGRTWPLAAGSASMARTETPPARLPEQVEGLVRALGWEGIFELEMLARPDGTHAAIDFNPRLYGSLALADAAGVPLPSIWCDWLITGKVRRRSARPGVWYRWEDAELRHALIRLAGGEVRSAMSILRPREPIARAYFRWTDPGPSAARMLSAIRARAGGDEAK